MRGGDLNCTHQKTLLPRSPPASVLGDTNLTLYVTNVVRQDISQRNAPRGKAEKLGSPRLHARTKRRVIGVEAAVVPPVVEVHSNSSSSRRKDSGDSRDPVQDLAPPLELLPCRGRCR